MPTQYAISANRAASSSSAKRAGEIVLSLSPPRAAIAAAKVVERRRSAAGRMCILMTEALHGKFVRGVGGVGEEYRC